MHRNYWKAEILTLPNALSLLRILLIPLYLRLYQTGAAEGSFFPAGMVMVLSCLTDLLDGKLARSLNRVTEVGKVLDPLADKLTQLALMLSLAGTHRMLLPMLAVFAAKELFQCFALVCFARKGKALSGALPAGKVSTAVLFGSLILLVLFPRLPESAVFFLTAMDCGLLLYAFVSYLLAYFGNEAQLRDLGPEA